MDPRQLDVVAQCTEHRGYRDGEFIVREGETADALFIVIRGRVSIVRHTDDDELQEVHSMGPGELFGELGLYMDRVRSASVRADGNAELLRLPYSALGTQDAASSSLMGRISPKLHRNLSELLAARFNALSDENVALLRARVQMGQFFVSILCFLSLYALGLSAMHTYEEQLGGLVPMISLLLLVLCALGSMIHIWSSGLTLAQFGVNATGWRKALGESLAISAAIMGGLTLVKWALIRWHPAFHDVPLIGFAARLESYGPVMLAALTASYALFSPVQEFLARGILQTSLEEFLTFRGKTVWAVIISNVLFSAIHLHVSYKLAGLALVSGLLWGWMYARHRTLLGVCVSHVLIGLYAIYVLASRPI